MALPDAVMEPNFTMCALGTGWRAEPIAQHIRAIRPVFAHMAGRTGKGC
jgi:hypothetical protein